MQFLVIQEDKISYDTMHASLNIMKNLNVCIRQHGYRFTSNSISWFHKISDWMYQTYERYYTRKFHYCILMDEYETMISSIHEIEKLNDNK